MAEAHNGRRPLHEAGFSYLPRFFSADEAQAMIDYFAGLHPIWERRYSPPGGRQDGMRQLTRPVYWLGAWQFACLGYYAEPHYREDRCVRAEPIPSVLGDVLARLTDLLAAEHDDGSLPNTCLINYYGREVGQRTPIDRARLKMHRDGEAGPVVMFNVGQPGLLEFLDPDRSPDPEFAVWTRHRSVAIISGPEFKDRLHHRVSRVRYGDEPVMPVQVDDFQLRRVSVSFRHVPQELIGDFGQLPDERREQVREYVERLAETSPHWAEQLLSG